MKGYYSSLALMVALTSATLGTTSCSQDDDLMACTPKVNCQKTLTFKGVVTDQLLGDPSGRVDTFDCYGMLVPSFTPKMLMDEGFEYSDLLDVKIGSDIEVKNVPFVTGFNEVGVLENCFCDYNALGQVYGFGQLHGNFKERIGGHIGDTITVSLAKRHGYAETWEIMKSVYGYDRSKYAEETDEEFANFRPVTTSGMGTGVLYRSSNPLNPKDNATRCDYVDSLARHYHIQSEIDLADTKEKIAEYRTRDDFHSTYCVNLYDQGKVITLGLTADTYGETFKKNLGDGLKFMLQNKPPYLLHCNEGKDRCGFVSMLLEAFAGASYQEVADDYMKTLMNFYQIEQYGESYSVRQTLSIDRLVWLLQNVGDVEDFCNIDWTGKDPQTVDLQKAAWDYVRDCGLSEAECYQLLTKLQTSLN